MIPFLCSNITTYGPQFRDFFVANAAKFAVWGLSEFHVVSDDVQDVTNSFKQANLNAHIAPARASGRGRGNSGGTAVVAVEQLLTFDLSQVGLQQARGEKPMDLKLVWVRGQQMAFVFLQGYLDPSVGLVGSNLQKLQNWAYWIGLYRVPLLLFADFQSTPEEMRVHPWLNHVGGESLLPEKTSISCTGGKGRMIDFIVASKGFSSDVANFRQWPVPWKPHLAFAFDVVILADLPRQRVQCKPWTPLLSKVRRG